MDNSVFFRPWVGKDYPTGGILGKKILVVGESHHCADHCAGCGTEACAACHAFTTNVIKDYLDPNKRERWMNTFLKFERSLVNRAAAGPEERQAIWDSLAFYNYLQVPMSQPRQAGTPGQYRAAALPFFSVLNELRPDALIVWGVRLWGRMTGEHWQGSPAVVVENYAVQNGHYTLDDGTPVPTVCVYHPAAGYRWDFWHKALQATVLK